MKTKVETRMKFNRLKYVFFLPECSFHVSLFGLIWHALGVKSVHVPQSVLAPPRQRKEPYVKEVSEYTGSVQWSRRSVPEPIHRRGIRAGNL